MRGPIVPPEGDHPIDETPKERLDRNWNELLQEMRVIQTGTQIITGFLLAAVFQSRFTDLDSYQLTVYLALVVISVLTTIAGLAPVSLHRYLFRKKAKDWIVAYADRFARITLWGVATTVTGISLLIFDFVLGRLAGIIAAGGIAAVLVGVWIVIPHRAGIAAKIRDPD
nr:MULTISPECIES: DUF6328 family protein [unclassified Leucobacter]